MTLTIYTSQFSFTASQKQELTALSPKQELVFFSDEEQEVVPFDAINIYVGMGANFSGLLAENTEQLKWVQATSAGINYYHLEELRSRGVSLTNVGGIHANRISEFIVSMAIFGTHQLNTAIVDKRLKRWNSAFYVGDSLEGKKILIFGCGHIGKKACEQLSTFGCSVYGVNTTGQKVGKFLDCFTRENVRDFLKDMDIVVNILPFTNETHHFFDRTFFDSCKKGVDFINVGRGKSVVETDLIHALISGQVRNAFLDVFEHEPLSPTSALWELDNVFITPHCAGNLQTLEEEIFFYFKENLTCFLENKPFSRGVVCLEKGY